MRRDSLDAWSVALEKLSLPPGLRRELRLSKAERFERIRSLGLQFTPVITTSLRDFFDSPGTFLEQVPGRSLVAFVDIISPKTSLPEIPQGPFARNKIAEQFKKTFEGLHPEDFLITFLKEHTILLNGNIIVKKDGGLYGEFVAGSRSPSQQRSIVACSVVRDPLLDTFKYSSVDPFIREKIYQAINALPGFGEGRERTFLYGYYEVGIGRDEESGIIRPIYYDFRNDPFFC